MSTAKAGKKSRTLMIVPTLGVRLDLLKLTLESFDKKHQGDYAPDVIVVVPLKNKEAVALAKEYGAEVADDPRTLSGAINVGIQHAKPHHEFITWMGDDDLLRPGSLEASVTLLDKHPEAVLAYGYCDYIEDDGKLVFTNRAGRLAPWIMRWGPNLVPLPGMLYRRAPLEKAGEFDVNLKYAMDLDMLLRLQKLGKFVNTKKTLAAFRWHSSSTTVANRVASMKEAEEIKRRYMHKSLHMFAPLWERPVRAATMIASKRVSKKAKQA